MDNSNDSFYNYPLTNEIPRSAFSPSKSTRRPFSNRGAPYPQMNSLRAPASTAPLMREHTDLHLSTTVPAVKVTMPFHAASETMCNATSEVHHCYLPLSIQSAVPNDLTKVSPGPAGSRTSAIHDATLGQMSLRESFRLKWMELVSPHGELGRLIDDVTTFKIMNSCYVTRRTLALLELCCYLVPIADQLIREHFINDKCSLFVGIRKRNVRGDSLHNFFQRLILATFFHGAAYCRTEVQTAWGNWLGVDISYPRGKKIPKTYVNSSVEGELSIPMNCFATGSSIKLSHASSMSFKSIKNERTLERCVSDCYKIVVSFGEDISRQLAQYVLEKNQKVSERTLREAANEFSLICGPTLCPGRPPVSTEKRASSEMDTSASIEASSIHSSDTDVIYHDEYDQQEAPFIG